MNNLLKFNRKIQKEGYIHQEIHGFCLKRLLNF